jgi:DNA-binding transcriptional regulator YiaG
MAALTAQGVAVATAKRAIETMLDRGEVVVAAPAVDDPKRVAKTLRAAGVYARRIGAVTIDVAGLRARLGLSQAEFARRFGLDVDTVQNWEQGRTSPDRTARALLRAIDGAPEAVAAALEEELV